MAGLVFRCPYVLRAHVCIRATGGHDRHRDWSHPVVQLCVEKIPLTIRLSSRGQKYIFFTARIISSPWRVFPAGRTRHDSCSLGPAAGGGVISPPLAEDGSIVSEPRRGEVWMVVLGMAASSASLGNQHAPGRSCWCNSRPLGSVRSGVGIHKSIVGNAISCDGFHYSPMGKSNSTAGVRKSRAAKAISAAGFRKSSAGGHFSTTNLTIPARERRFPSLDFTNPAREKRFRHGISQILRRRSDFPHWIW